MRLIKENVERIAEGEDQAARLRAMGFKEISSPDAGGMESPPPGAGEREEKPLKNMKADELKALAKEKDIEGAASLTKAELLAVLEEVV